MSASRGLWVQGELLWCAVVAWGDWVCGATASVGLTVTCPTVCPRWIVPAKQMKCQQVLGVVHP